MTEITNMKDLQAAITQLKMEVTQRDGAMKQQISAIKESMKPANILAAAFSKITGHTELNYERRHSFSVNVIRSGLALWLRRGLFKAETRVENKVYDVIDSAFDRIKDFLRKKA
jgi:hypothetical protein